MADDRNRLFARPDAPHRVHDLLLVAGFAAGDADPPDADRARAMVEACAECAALAEDLRAIQRTMATTPVPERPRDFRLTKADAERLRPTGLRGVLSVVARPRMERAHPVAAGLTMLGITGLLVSSLSFGAPAAADPGVADEAKRDSVQLQVDSAAPAAGSPAPEFGATGGGGESRDVDGGTDARPDDRVVAESADGPRLLIAVASAVATLAGLALFVVARRQRRRYG